MEDSLAIRRRIERLYAAFNRRDVAGAFKFLTPTVTWANGWEGGYVTGRAEVAEYWSRQWKQIDPTVIPLMISATPDGSRVSVQVHQVVHDTTGTLLSDGNVTHLYTFDNRLVTRMDIIEDSD